MKYFLTGATGFIGGVLARQLHEAGHEVTAIVRNPSKANDLRQVGVQLAQGDVTDQASMRAPMTGVDGVFHVAGWYKIGVRDKSEAFKINVDGTRNVLELMRELGIPKGVYTSTLAVNSNTHGKLVDETYRFTGQHISVYDESKAKAHDVAEGMIKAGLPLVIVQPGLVYGPEDTSTVRVTLRQVVKQQLPMMPKETAYSWAHVEDIAQSHWLAMERGRIGQSYFVCGSTHSLVEAFTMAAKIANVRPPMQAAPGMLKAMAAINGLVEKIVPLPPTYSSEGLRVLAAVTYIGDNGKAKRELGYAPRAFEAGWSETVRHEIGTLQAS